MSWSNLPSACGRCGEPGYPGLCPPCRSTIKRHVRRRWTDADWQCAHDCVAAFLCFAFREDARLLQLVDTSRPATFSLARRVRRALRLFFRSLLP